MKLYVDMDEVLAGFRTGVETLSAEAAEGLSEDATELQKQNMYDAIEAAGEKFWSTLPWKTGAKELWAIVGPLNPVLLSSPGEFSYAESGKLQWIRRNIPGTPVFFSNNKQEYVDRYEMSILIDDNKNNISMWEEAGGVGILHTSTETTERQLLDLLWPKPELDPADIYWK